VPDATVCRWGRRRRNCLARAIHPLLLLLPALGAASGLLACRNDRRPGVLIEVEVDKEEFRPEVLQFDWMAPGRGVLVRGELSPHLRPDDETFFASLFIETRGRLQDPRVIALQGRDGAGNNVSGGYVVVQPSIEDFRSFRLRLGPPLPDSDGDGTPDIVERCTAESDTSCAGPPDAGPPPTPDAAPEDTAPPEDAALEDTAVPDTLPDAGSDTRDASPDSPG
jgi:hypothetical protein